MAEDSIRLPHKLTLNERKSLTMTGVTEVVNFDENTVVMHTCLGKLMVHGKQLQLKNLSPDGGQVAIAGEIAALVYEEPRPTGNWLRRFMG